MIIDNKNSSIKKRTLLKSSNCNLTDIDQVKLYNSIPYSNDLLLNLNSLESKKLFMKINNENKENMSKVHHFINNLVNYIPCSEQKQKFKRKPNFSTLFD